MNACSIHSVHTLVFMYAAERKTIIDFVFCYIIDTDFRQIQFSIPGAYILSHHQATTIENKNDGAKKKSKLENEKKELNSKCDLKSRKWYYVLHQRFGVKLKLKIFETKAEREKKSETFEPLK